MARFFAGFFLASLLWGGLGYAHFVGWLDGWGDEQEPQEQAAVSSDAGVIDDAGPVAMRRRRRRTRRGRMRANGRDWSGEGVSGDDLGEDAPREIDGAGQGGEQQLSGAQIEAGFDQVFGRIRRCLVLVPEDAPAHGRVVFGLRIASSGRVTRVNLRGPRAVTQSEAGTCLRQAARAISFPSFDGPEMVVRYPLTLE